MRRRNWFVLLAAVFVLMGTVALRTRQGCNLSIAPLYQRNYRETICVIDGKARTVSNAGCGAVCVQMVLNTCLGDTGQTPEDLFRAAYAEGNYNGNGLSHEALTELLAQNGLLGEWHGRSPTRILRALRAGHPVIAHMGRGTFTRNGHYILLTGITPDGDVLVNDPASAEGTGQAYSLELLFSESKTEYPFCICRL